ncbi:MAG: hypothetical protein BM558_07190 [Roseobacter sp. MedPE-SW]|nr:MAG: hypothetical protein BM558_07190 [Roseobacter sp. MedPE-SW]
MDVSKIVDRDSFKTWLEKLPKERRYEWGVSLATRAALRVFPVWAVEMPRDWARKRDLTVLPLSRSLLISVVAVKMPTTDIRDAADASYVASYAANAANAASCAANAAKAASYAVNASSSSSSSSSSYAASYASASYAASYASAVSWTLLRGDILELEQGADLRRLRLWPQEMPPEIAEAWTTGRTWMEPAPGHAFWIRWYDAILAGRPLTGDWDSHWQLMHDIALIDPDDWGKGKEQDAIHVAGIIAKIEDTYSYRVTDTTLSEATTLLHAALGQFGFDEIRRLMELLPFAEDLKQLKDPEAVAAFVAAMDQQRREIETFLRGVDREGRGLQGAGGILTYFEEVLEEVSKARQLNQLNVGWIIDCGEILQGYAQNSDTVAELGPLNIPFQRTLQNLLDQIHNHFSATLLRFGVLRDIRSSEETKLGELMEDLRRGLEQIKHELPEGHVAMAPETIAVFEKLFDDLDGMIRREFVAVSPAMKSQLRKNIDYRLAQVAVSLRLYWEQSAAPRRAVGQVIAGVAKKKTEEGVEGLVKWVLDNLK